MTSVNCATRRPKHLGLRTGTSEGNAFTLSYNASRVAGKVPVSGNILFMDNRVESREFRHIQCWGNWNNNRHMCS